MGTTALRDCYWHARGTYIGSQQACHRIRFHDVGHTRGALIKGKHDKGPGQHVADRSLGSSGGGI